MKNFYITTAIDYANGAPHLGHAYEKVLTDVIARYRRLKGESVRFQTGLDEHGQKVEQGAEAEGIEPQVRCDRISEDFKGLCARLKITHDNFVRTTDESHKKVVCEILQKLFDNGDIYKGEYKGYYSQRQEQFLTLRDQEEGEWPALYGEVIEITEPAYFFKLKQHQDWLIQHLNDNDDFIFPKFRKNQVTEFLKEPLNDLCISRPLERLKWGIPLPFDEGFVTYVWFDALLNYISGAAYGTDEFEKNWPADYHVIGKDILVPPHAVYWPIMLKAAGFELPKTLLVHGWWLQSGEKMSKSSGKAVNPLDLIDQYGVDAFRYYVIREMKIGHDSNFSTEIFETRYKSDLGNDLGNLVSRAVNMTARYGAGIVPAETISGDPEKEVKETWENTIAELGELMDKFQYHIALEKILNFVRSINRYAETRAPWQLAKSEEAEDKKTLETSLAVMNEGIRLASAVLTPFMPDICLKINQTLGVSETVDWDKTTVWGDSLKGNTLGEKVILFPRIES